MINRGIVFSSCYIYTAAVKINCLQYWFVLSHQHFDPKHHLIFCVLYLSVNHLLLKHYGIQEARTLHYKHVVLPKNNLPYETPTST